MQNDTAWHTLEIRDAAQKLSSDPARGISHRDADIRLREYGPNELAEGRQRTPLMMLAGQFKDFMIIVLIAAAVVSGVLGEAVDTMAIVVIVVLNAVIGAAQEYKAEESMRALKKMAAPEASVIREGVRLTVPASGLVPGDLVILEAGMIVPADLRIAESASLRLDESALTGESVPVDKTVTVVPEPGAAVPERRNMVFKGTTVSLGRGRGMVVATGMDTELGRIAALLGNGSGTKTPLQKRLADFGRKLSLAILAICAVIFAAGLMRGVEPVLMFLTAVSLAVAAIPEALPAVVTVSLALGAKKMVLKNALIRKLPAVETLGSVTYICTDKTGTLTRNRMRVVRYFARDGFSEGPPENPVGPAGLMLTSMALCNDAAAVSGELTGDPTEVALYEASASAGFERGALEARYPRMAEVPFDSERKLMSTLHADPEAGYILITKGALEAVLARSVSVLGPGGEEPLDAAGLTLAAEKAASEGLRVLAFGVRRMEDMPATVDESDEQGLAFVGFVGLMDPPREEAAQAVADCASAGIRTVMITGDHPLTASRIARDLGISRESSEVMTGPSLARLPLEELERKVEGVMVYARVAPEQKLKIVRALQDRGQFVAMTGDGVNDAPALKMADIGVSMGRCGTEVARESSDMVLLDDNFATIVNAVREGRRIYDNIRKFIRYTMTSNSGEIWTLFIAPFLGLPVPLLPVQILWINLVTDGLPGLALAFEPQEPGLMRRPPRHPKEGVFAHGMAYQIVWVGLLMAGVCITIQAWAISSGNQHWQSMVFTALCLLQMGNALAVRSETRSFFSLGVFTNPLLIFSVVLTFVLQMGVLYLPVCNRIFKTSPLTAGELGATVLLSFAVFVAVELEKYFKRQMKSV
jgi:P-type Ca2+ transporter type 2C